METSTDILKPPSAGIANNGSVRDVRGRIVPTIDPLKVHLRGRSNVIDRAALDAVIEELEPGIKKRVAFLKWLVPAIVLLVGGGIGLSIFLEGQSAWNDLKGTLVNPALFGAYFCCFFTPWIAMRQKRFRRVPAILLKHRCCPHCGYGLRGLPVDPVDGATICPECACAWKLDEPQRVGIASAAERPNAHLLIMLVLVGLTFFGVLLAIYITHR